MPPNRVRAHARRLADAPLCELPLLFADWVEFSDAATGAFRNRIFTLSRTFWLFLHQVLGAGGTCSEAVARGLSWLAVEEGEVASPSTSAYCQARRRLPAEALGKIERTVALRLEREGDSWRWHGRAVKVVDGSSVSMPDTPANQARWPQPSGQRPGCGFPVMRLVAMFSLATGALLRSERGPLSDSELTLWRRMWGDLAEGDVVLADRGFCNFADLALLGRRGVDAVVRLNARRGAGVEEVARLGRGDRLVDWVKAKDGERPKWISDADWQALPARLRVRHVTFTVAREGCRTREVTVATTLLDPKLHPARDFAELYRRRWRAELFLKDLKVTLGMDPLRCKSPEMVGKELTMHLLAYNLVRALMAAAALEYPCCPTELSFARSLAMARQWAPAMEEAQGEGRHREMLGLLLYYLAHLVVPERPGRSEPRARKRRPKNYQLLNKPRHLMKTMPHRNKHQRPLT